MILCQRLPCVKGAKLTEGLFCVDYRFLQSLRHGKSCHLSLRLGHVLALALLTQFTTKTPLRYLYTREAWF